MITVQNFPIILSYEFTIRTKSAMSFDIATVLNITINSICYNTLTKWHSVLIPES